MIHVLGRFDQLEESPLDQTSVILTTRACRVLWDFRIRHLEPHNTAPSSQMAALRPASLRVPVLLFLVTPNLTRQ